MTQDTINEDSRAAGQFLRDAGTDSEVSRQLRYISKELKRGDREEPDVNLLVRRRHDLVRDERKRRAM